MQTGVQGSKAPGILEILGRSLETGIQGELEDSHNLGKKATGTVGMQANSSERGVLGRRNTGLQGNPTHGFLGILDKERRNAFADSGLNTQDK